MDREEQTSEPVMAETPLLYLNLVIRNLFTVRIGILDKLGVTHFIKSQHTL